MVLKGVDGKSNYDTSHIEDVQEGLTHADVDINYNTNAT